ncbi:hypothetical protein [Paenibacillus odorifer]|uniref:hypothetical protein n=1 Tax=Paenibacillus odorifer TaxID=189426 RepID=UPI00096C2339|nr:hypothetical protein [Paenibacillus odorifer]OME27761.1 hypothetical protein BSK57_03870 [Paenibacillus odorifer]
MWKMDSAGVQLFNAIRSNDKAIFKQLGVSVDYKIKSVIQLEKLLVQLYSEMKTSIPSIIVAAVGYYYGQTLIRNFKNGIWVTDEGTSLKDIFVEIEINNEITIMYPFRRVMRFLENQEYSMTAIYNAMKAMTGTKRNISELPKKTTINYGGMLISSERLPEIRKNKE